MKFVVIVRPTEDRIKTPNMIFFMFVIIDKGSPLYALGFNGFVNGSQQIITFNDKDNVRIRRKFLFLKMKLIK